MILLHDGFCGRFGWILAGESGTRFTLVFYYPLSLFGLLVFLSCLNFPNIIKTLFIIIFTYLLVFEYQKLYISKTRATNLISWQLKSVSIFKSSLPTRPPFLLCTILVFIQSTFPTKFQFISSFSSFPLLSIM